MSPRRGKNTALQVRDARREAARAPELGTMTKYGHLDVYTHPA